MYDSSKQKDFFWGALVGGTIATLTALLFTTQTGRKLQRQIGTVYDELENTVKTGCQETKEKAKDIKEKVEHLQEDHKKESK